MKARSPVLAAAAAFAAILVAGAVQAQSTGNVGVDAAIRNSVAVRPAGGAAARAAVLREPVRLGDAFTSGPQSSLQVLLLDRSVFTIGANARIAIDRFVYDPGRNASDVAASMTRGAFRFMSGRSLGGQGQRAITTPVATIGVRGTIVDGAVGEDVLSVLKNQPGLPALTGDLTNLTLIVLRGPGPFSDGFDKPGAIDVTLVGGKVITLDRPGEALLIFDGAPPFGPFRLSDPASIALANLLLPPAGGTPGGGLKGSIRLGSGDPGKRPTDPLLGDPGGDRPISIPVEIESGQRGARGAPGSLFGPPPAPPLKGAP